MTATGDPLQTCDCPHEKLCEEIDCTQCCRFDVTPDPNDCHH